MEGVFVEDGEDGEGGKEDGQGCEEEEGKEGREEGVGYARSELCSSDEYMGKVGRGRGGTYPGTMMVKTLPTDSTCLAMMCPRRFPATPTPVFPAI